jgi:hypothetical protein
MHAPIAPMTAATGPASGVALVRHGVAYGLRLTGCFPARGLWTGVGSAAMRSASLEVVEHAELAGWWPARGCESLLRLPPGRGGPVLALDTHPDKGYLVRADGFGAYLIAPDGQRILLAPGAVEPWRWQRLLTAQALPVAALLQRLELFHASAVRINGRVLAFTGASGAGKTSLAVQLLLAGATFLRRCARPGSGGEVVIAHPGSALMNLRGSTMELLDAHERARLGVEVGRDEGGSRMLVRRKAESSQLHATYLLRHRGHSGGGIRLERLSPPAPRQLLGAGFGTAIRTPARLVRRLDLCAHIARRVPVFALEAPAHATPGALAEAVVRHVLGRAL